MNDKHSQITPIPEEFASYEEAADFWDTHDTTDYLDSLETVSIERVEIKRRQFEVEVDADLMKVLYDRSLQRGVGVSQLVNDLLRSTIGDVA